MKTQTTVKILPVIVCLFISACSTSTRITGSWKDPAVDASTGESKSVLITALSRNIEVRTKLENALAAKAANLHIKAVKSSDVFTPIFFKTSHRVMNYLPESGRPGWTPSSRCRLLIKRAAPGMYVVLPAMPHCRYTVGMAVSIPTSTTGIPSCTTRDIT